MKPSFLPLSRGKTQLMPPSCFISQIPQNSFKPKKITWLGSPLVMRKAAREATAAVMRTTTAPILMAILFFCSRDFRAAASAGGSALGSGSNPPLPFPETKESLQ